MVVIPLLIVGAVSLIAIATVLGAAKHYKSWLNTHYVCPDCSLDFKPATFTASVFSMFSREYKRLKCPGCGHNDLMKRIEE